MRLGRLRQGLRAVFRLGLRAALAAVFAGAVYGTWLVHHLDLSRDAIIARASGVEATLVPHAAAGIDGRFFDAALEMPLALSAERIPAFVKDAVIASEDQQFRWHIGVNPLTLVRALLRNHSNPEGKRVGGSTITMQLVKNVLLNQQQTLDRKAREIVLALIVERLFTKDEILAMYLNTAYFGGGATGIEAAARTFFGRSVGYAPRVNLLEAAMLARSLRQPSRVNPNVAKARLVREARALIAAMQAEGYPTNVGQALRGRGDRSWGLDPFVFRDIAMRFMVPQALATVRDQVVMGFTMETEAQLYAELAARDVLKQSRPLGYDSSAIVVMEPDGAIAAMATGHDYDGVDLVRNGRVSPGSALKPFMALCALEHGMRPDSVVVDAKRAFRPGWVVRNFDKRYHGEVTLDVALARSLNTVAVSLYDAFGSDCFDRTLRRFGIVLDDPAQPTSVLGSEPVSLLRLAAAYATLANGGYAVEPYAVRYARSLRGATIYARQAPERLAPVVEGQPYCDLLSMLRSVTAADGTGHNAAFAHPVWGKTGTSSGFRDALFVGFTGHYVTVVWLGRQAKGEVRREMTGGGLPAQTFRWLMANLHDGKPVRDVACPVRVAMTQVAAAE